ncbi:hypothetical protein ASD04_06340 [Devosia sp. Root436]|uniref:FAD-dependent monooxygenase n=1 Tax=Devosia sp. Root436 TaxID=1736537 RepID=UPI0006FC394C|nr:FAD-dependent monooxygenase [Devosia sp. Root436]KQX40249.1 hypothetical protein ASD04_06340 [Devosia sp. Root436]
MTQHAVVIAGGGPTGLMLAGELKLAGVDVAIVERRPGHDFPGTRARGLHARTIEVLDQRGIAGRFLAEGRTAQVAGFGGTSLDISDFPTRHNYGLALLQQHFERILGGWIDELGVTIYRGCEVAGFVQHDQSVDITLADGRALAAGYLIGCDGGRSLVRKLAGIDFPGSDPTVSNLIAEVELSGEPEWGLRTNDVGVEGFSRIDAGLVGIILTERFAGQSSEPSLDDLKATLFAHYGTDYGAANPRWISRFTDMTRQASTYRNGRILLAGDAAHIHYPAGGQGLNMGVLDAVNLGWKLAQVVKHISPASLLDTYEAERHPPVARALRYTMAQVALGRGDDRTKALKQTLSELLGMDEPRKRMAAEMSGLGIHYDFGAGHPLLGRRMPDLDLQTAGGPVRVYTLLHAARPILLNFGAPGSIDLSAWSDRVQLVEADYAGIWELPVLGAVSGPGAVLVRPDGHVAWTGDQSRNGLDRALSAWFG